MRSPTDLTVMFRDRGLKMTPQRQCIFRVLYGRLDHPTAEDVYNAVSTEMPTISRRTVYQTLHDLSDMGEIVELDLGTGAARFDPTVSTHHHVVCEECGKVRDVYVDFTEFEVPPQATEGFTVSSTEIVFRGRCNECAVVAGVG